MLLACSLVVPSVVAAQNDAASSTAAKAPTRAEINELCTLIRREIAKLPAEPSIVDAEAAIVYGLSQANPRREVIDPALDCVAGGEKRPNVLQAIENVRRSYRSGGTGAIRYGGGGDGGNSSLFSPPVVGVGGGGGANYTDR